jgi:hypothetical protein
MTGLVTLAETCAPYAIRMPAATADRTIFGFFTVTPSYSHFLVFGPDGRPDRTFTGIVVMPA